MPDVRLLLGDCLELMQGIEADACISDPPYGIRYSPRQITAGSKAWGAKNFVGDCVVAGDEKEFDPSPFLGYRRVVLCGANHYAASLPNSPEWVIWDKRDGTTSNDFADCEMIWTNGGGVARVFRHRWMGAIRDSERGEPRLHPTQKPLALMRWLVERYSSPGDVVLDPFMGSGTTGVACVQTGRNFIGMEIDPQYFAIAQKRITEAQAQMRMPL